MCPAGTQFGRQHVLELLKQIGHQPAGQIVARLHEAVHKFHAGDEPHGDATAIVARVL